MTRAFIARARKENPSVPDDLTEYMASVYASMRQDEAKTSTPHSYTTVRTLLSILRLAMVCLQSKGLSSWCFVKYPRRLTFLYMLFQALARLRPSKFVAQSDVDEALRLMRMSKFSLYSDERRRSGLDAISDIYSIIRDEAARMNAMDVRYAHALNWISRKVIIVYVTLYGKSSPCIFENQVRDQYCSNQYCGVPMMIMKSFPPGEHLSQ